MTASQLARYHAEHHPADAARQLESLSPVATAEFVRTLEPRIGARLLTHMLPSVASDCLFALPADVAAAIGAALPPGVGARQLAAGRVEQRDAVLSSMPEERVRQLRHMLRYPEGSVGSVMITDVLSCRDTATVRQVRSMVREHVGDVLPVCFVLDDGARPIGVIDANTLIKAPEEAQAASHMRRLSMSLRARADLETITDHAAWQVEAFLPVVDTDGVLVGALPAGEVYRRLVAARQAGREDDLMDTLVSLADLFWRPGAELLARVSSEEKEGGDGR